MNKFVKDKIDFGTSHQLEQQCPFKESRSQIVRSNIFNLFILDNVSKAEAVIKVFQNVLRHREERKSMMISRRLWSWIHKSPNCQLRALSKGNNSGNVGRTSVQKLSQSLKILRNLWRKCREQSFGGEINTQRLVNIRSWQRIEASNHNGEDIK